MVATKTAVVGYSPNYVLSAPGKLMISGEWSVLEQGVPCLVVAVDSRVYASIEEATTVEVVLRDFGVNTTGQLTPSGLELEDSNTVLLFTRYAVDVAVTYLRAKKVTIKSFRLETWADQTWVRDKAGKKLKVGFGSSAASVVAIIAAVLRLHDELILDGHEVALPSKTLLYKLGIIAHYEGQGKLGSGFDVAASAFGSGGGALLYKRFDPDWLEKALKEKKLLQVLQMRWPLLEHRTIPLPADLQLLVGFTGVSASTRKLVRQIRSFKQENPTDYYRIINALKTVTQRLACAFEEDEGEERRILDLLEENRILLRELSEVCSCQLEIPEHRLMSNIAARFGGVAKFSGAGGGDCAIGVCFSEEKGKKIIEGWEQAGLTPLDTSISPHGPRLEIS